jgi:iron complex outermembrane receptor protein
LITISIYYNIKFASYIFAIEDILSATIETHENTIKTFEKIQKIVGFDIDSIYDTWNSNFKYRYIDYKGENGNVMFPFMFQQSTGNLSRFFAIQNQEHQEHALQYT